MEAILGKRISLNNNHNKSLKASPVCGRSLELNVSHQGSYSVLAAEWDKKVGVDIMESTRPS